MARQSPRISMMKLAEYMTASPLRRRRIVLDQHDPPSAIVPQYRRAAAPVVRFFRKGASDLSIIEKGIDKLERREPKSEWDERDLANSAQALRHFMNVFPQLQLGDRLLARRGRRSVMLLEDVEVSVRPHVRIVATRGDRLRVGAVKFSFSKTRPLGEDEGSTAAVLLRVHLDQRLGPADQAQADPSLCQVVDLFSERVFAAPKAYKRVMQNATACCEEIRGRWPEPEAVSRPDRVDRPIDRTAPPMVN